MSRRGAIRMTEEEALAYLAEQRTVICATNGHDGFPHLMPLWYVVRDGSLWAWSYAKSQKVRNLERDPRATLQVEDGEQYHELRGVMIESEAVIHRELDEVAQLGAQLFERYGSGSTGPEFLEAVRAQAARRVALEFVRKRLVSWDHRKLGGVY